MKIEFSPHAKQRIAQRFRTTVAVGEEYAINKYKKYDYTHDNGTPMSAVVLNVGAKKCCLLVARNATWNNVVTVLGPERSPVFDAYVRLAK